MKKLSVQWIPEDAASVAITHREAAPPRAEVPVSVQTSPRAVSRKVIVITPDGAMLRQCIRAT